LNSEFVSRGWGVQYATARLGIAVSSTPEGPYVYKRSFRPHGEESRDFTLYQVPCPAVLEMCIQSWLW